MFSSYFGGSQEQNQGQANVNDDFAFEMATNTGPGAYEHQIDEDELGGDI